MSLKATLEGGMQKELVEALFEKGMLREVEEDKRESDGEGDGQENANEYVKE